jgi:AAA+ superfamily predicted ATPase
MVRIRQALQNLQGYRYALLFGPGVSDLHFNKGNGEQEFTIALEKELLTQGINSLFIAPHRRPFSELQENQFFFEPYQITQSPKVLLESQLRGMQPGPFGDRFILGSPIPQISEGQLVGDDHSLRIFDLLISTKQETSVNIIILNAEIYLRYFEDQRTLNGFLGKWNQLPSTNQNRVIFCFNSDSLSQLEQSIESLQIPILKNFSAIFDQPLEGPIRFVSNPGLIEISMLIRYFTTLRNSPLTDLEVKRISRWMVREDHSFSFWLTTLGKLPAITPQTIRQAISFDLNKDLSLPAMKRLEDLIGLESIKKTITQLDEWVRSSVGNDPLTKGLLLNMVFSGPPGVGKTTVARLIGEILFEAGYLDRGQTIECSPTNLVADHVGGTAKLVNTIVDKAIGGVLFIDEAYGLAESDRGAFGQEAIETLLSRMERDQGKFVVILAGYQRQFVKLFRQNPGLDRRFPNEFRINFRPYSKSELTRVFIQQSVKNGFQITGELSGNLETIFDRLSSTSDSNFGNVGEVINIYNAVQRDWQIKNLGAYPEEPRVLDSFNLPKDYGNLTAPDIKTSIEVFSRLKKMKGLNDVKSALRRIIHRVDYENHRRRIINQPASRLPNLHQVFVGNPGTGKTTVARMYGELLQMTGYLLKGHTVEVNAPTLITSYAGESSRQLQNLVGEALDGVLFIDEAYALARGPAQQLGAASYEVIDTLVKAIEDNKNRLVVVVAGYPQEMHNFLESNPGLSSRFSEPLFFADLSLDHMLDLLHQYAQEEEYILPDTVAREAARKLFHEQQSSDTHFGNARSVRRLYEEMKNRLAERTMISIHDQPSGRIDAIKDWNCFSMADLANENIQVVISDTQIPGQEPVRKPMMNWVVKK